MNTAYFADDLSEFGSAPAAIWEGGSLSYEDLADAADAFADRLGAERRLLLLECPNSVEALIAYVGALRGRHPVILTSAGHPADVQRLIVNYEPSARYLISDAGWKLSVEADGPALHRELAVLLSTSGTTGATKLVRLSRSNIDANARSIATYLELSGRDRAITSLPFHYSYGLSVVNSHLAVGAALVLTDHSVIDDGFWRFFGTAQATSLAGVPYTYELLDRIGFRDKPLPTLRSLTQAGGRLPPDTAARYAEWSRDRGIRFFVMYGQTEATARMAYMPPEMLANKPDSIGIPIPNGKFVLEDEDGKPISSPETTGELIYSGPNVMMGYAEQVSDLAKDAEVEVLKTGDLAQYDSEGFYRIVGRKNRFSKLFGLRIALDEVEKKLRAQGFSGVAAGDDELIAVALTGDADPLAVQRMLSQAYSLPLESFSVSTAADLPLLPSGKVNYRLILSVAKALKAALPDDISDLDVYSVFAQAMPTRTITQDDSFLSLGGDSLAFISIHSKLDDMAGSLPEGWEERSIADLQLLVSKNSRIKLRPWNIRPVATDMFLRSIAIIMIVANHIMKSGGGGGVDILLLLMGISLMRFQRQKLLSDQRWRIALDTFVRIIIPYYIILIFYDLTLGSKVPVYWVDYLLVGNMNYRGWTIQLYWFILAYFQSIIIILSVLSIPSARRALADRPLSACVTALACLMVIKVVAMPLLHPQVLEGKIPASFTGHTPDQFLYLPALGACIYFCRSQKDKIMVALISVCIALMTYSEIFSWWKGFNGPLRGPYLVLATIMLLSTKSLPLPNVLAKVINVVASASFVIYLSHVLLLVVWHRLTDHGHVLVTPITKILAIGTMLLIGTVLSQLLSVLGGHLAQAQRHLSITGKWRAGAV